MVCHSPAHSRPFSHFVAKIRNEFSQEQFDYRNVCWRRRLKMDLEQQQEQQTERLQQQDDGLVGLMWKLLEIRDKFNPMSPVRFSDYGESRGTTTGIFTFTQGVLRSCGCISNKAPHPSIWALQPPAVTWTNKNWFSCAQSSVHLLPNEISFVPQPSRTNAVILGPMGLHCFDPRALALNG